MAPAWRLQWPPDSDSTFASVTELVKAGEQDWAGALLLLLPVCDVYTRCWPHGPAVSTEPRSHRDYTTAVTDTGTRGHTGGAREQRAPSRAAGAGRVSLAPASCDCHPAPPPQAGDQLSLPGPRPPAQWPVGAGVCYELTSAEH